MPETSSKYLLLLTIGLIYPACAAYPPECSQTVAEYYTVYQARKDFQRFLDFYDENAILEDMISGDRIVGKSALNAFFDWNNPDYHNSNKDALVITTQTIQDTVAVTAGYFTAFNWRGNRFEAMHFTTILTFNSAGKIVKQVDWINYPGNLLDYGARKNSNAWIGE